MQCQIRKQSMSNVQSMQKKCIDWREKSGAQMIRNSRMKIREMAWMEVIGRRISCRQC
jgi:hypothetical protein